MLGNSCEVVWSEVQELDSDDWNQAMLPRWVKGSWFQATHYNEDKRNFSFEDPFYLRQLSDGGQLLAQAIIRLTHPYEWGFFRRNWTKLNPLAKKLFPILLCNQAPTVLKAPHTTEAYRSLGRWALEKGDELGCLYVRLIPAYYQDSYIDNRVRIRSDLEELGYTSSPKATLIVDLQQDEEILFSSLKKEARNKVRKAKKQGVQILEVSADDEGLGQLHNVMAETSKRNGITALTFEDLKKSSWFRHYADGFSRAFVSVHNGNLVSSQMAVVYNGAIILGGVSYTEYSRRQGIYGNDLMQWHMIKWGHRQGLNSLDYAGIEPYSSSPKMRAIYDFKTKWGGVQVDYDEFVFEFSNVRSLLFRSLINKVGMQLKKMIRLL